MDSRPSSTQDSSTQSWFGPLGGPPEAWPLLAARETASTSFARLWRAFMSARIVLAGVLLLLQGFIFSLGNVADLWSIGTALAYLVATVAVRVGARPKPPGSTFDLQWLFTIGVDVAAFSALNFLQPTGINYTPLFALPVLLASVLGPVQLALGTAASVTFILLFDAWWSSLHANVDLAARFLQSGLSGSGFFLIAVLAHQLALRLVREERRSRSNRYAARMQTQVNELVVESIADGIVVVDEQGVVRSANPASARLLDAADRPRATPFALSVEPSWQVLAELARSTFSRSMPQDSDVSLDLPGQGVRRLHVRTRLALSHDRTRESLCVMFLEDLREMEAKVRTEKMAAMGRMSAAVAHEIRNPLAAISQANALLEEDLLDPGHRQLTAMVRQNALRLSKTVDDILNIARAQTESPEQQRSQLVLDPATLRVAGDWMQQSGAQGRVQLGLRAPGALVTFDPDHLRRLLINLLDNALRYASMEPHAIAIATSLHAHGHARLTVWSDGAPLEKTVEAHLFEPFFSSESRSSGLGLYICRELCERYGASIGYCRSRRGEIEGNEFFVVFKPALRDLPRPLTAARPLTA
jgi:two-component system, NtrC family, sensor histidine kinase PilS